MIKKNDTLEEEIVGLLEPTQLNIEYYLNSVNSQGRIQVYIMIVQSTLSFISGMVLFSIPYIFYKPDFMCKDSSGIYTSCSSKTACQKGVEFQIVSGTNNCRSEKLGI